MQFTVNDVQRKLFSILRSCGLKEGNSLKQGSTALVVTIKCTLYLYCQYDLYQDADHSIVFCFFLQRSQSSEKARRPSVEAEESVKLRNLKKYVRACGMHVQKYATLFEGCRSMAAKERRLDSYIREETAIEGLY